MFKQNDEQSTLKYCCQNSVPLIYIFSFLAALVLLRMRCQRNLAVFHFLNLRDLSP
jgi:hypothetical protein